MSKDSRLRLIWVGVLVLAGGSAQGQALAAAEARAAETVTASASTNNMGPAGIVPFMKGFNASMGSSSQHDSSDGWSSVLIPDIAYRFNRRYSVDVALPVYSYVSVEDNLGTEDDPDDVLVTRRFVVGDMPVSGHVELRSEGLTYNGTAVLGLPTGNTDYGLGAGRVTYDFNNHFEHDVGIFTPDVEVGITNSSGLVNTRIRKDYTTVGIVAHFQVGGSVSLPRKVNFEAEAYEQLPMTSSTTYSSTDRGEKKVTTATTEGLAEDNGFLTSLDIPVSGHVTLSGFYNRSLRNRDDTAGFSLTFLLKSPASQVR